MPIPFINLMIVLDQITVYTKRSWKSFPFVSQCPNKKTPQNFKRINEAQAAICLFDLALHPAVCCIYCFNVCFLNFDFSKKPA